MAATERITIYVTKADKKRIFSWAKTKNKSASEFARDTTLEAVRLGETIKFHSATPWPKP